MKSVQLSGILGAILIFFGLITSFFVASDEFYFAYAHFIIGAFLLLLFLFKGGLNFLRSLALKRAASFAAGATLYSSLFVGVLVLLNVFVARHDPLYIDTTEQKVHTLAPQTKDVLTNLSEDVVARGFFVGQQIAPEVRELLDRMQKHSAKFSWQMIDPEKRPELVELYGINERDSLHFSFNSKTNKRSTKITRDLSEQSIVNALLKLTRGGEKTLCSVSGHGEADFKGTEERGYLFLKEAIEGENVKVSELQLINKAKIPTECSAIALMAPRRSLAEEEKKLLVDYLAKGGSAIFLNEANTTSDIAELVKPFGIRVGNDIVLDEVVRLAEGTSVGAKPLITTYVKHDITNDFDQPTVFTTVSSIGLLSGVEASDNLTELAFSSDNSWAESNLALLFSETHEAALEENDIPGPVSVAVAYQGADVEISAAGPDKKKVKKRSRVVVFGDVDFVSNVNIRQFFNRDFFLNSMNWVLAQEQGVSIRARTLRQSTKGLSEQQFRSMFLTAGVLLPELVVLFGFLVWWLRAK